MLDRPDRMPLPPPAQVEEVALIHASRAFLHEQFDAALQALDRDFARHLMLRQGMVLAKDDAHDLEIGALEERGTSFLYEPIARGQE